VTAHTRLNRARGAAVRAATHARAAQAPAAHAAAARAAAARGRCRPHGRSPAPAVWRALLATALAAVFALAGHASASAATGVPTPASALATAGGRPGAASWLAISGESARSGRTPPGSATTLARTTADQAAATGGPHNTRVRQVAGGGATGPGRSARAAHEQATAPANSTTARAAAGGEAHDPSAQRAAGTRTAGPGRSALATPGVAAAATDPTPAEGFPAATGRTARAPAARVVIIGVPGLEWADLAEGRTPNLWGLVGRGGSASLSARTVPPPDRGITCRVGGWLTVSAGQRAGSADATCPAPPTPVRGADGSARVPGWAELDAFNAASSYRARIGLLGQAVRDAGGRVAAVGAGAALGAADRSGSVPAYAESVEELGELAPYRLVVVEIDDLARATPDGSAPSPEARQRAAQAADARLGDVLRRIPDGTTVLLAGVSDITEGPRLHVAIATGPAAEGTAGGGPYPRGHLTAASTRQDALVTITDLTATALTALGLPNRPGMVGRAWVPGGPAPASTAETVAALADGDLASQVLRTVRAPFFSVFVAVQLLFYGAAAIAVRRRPGRGRALVATQVVAVVSGGVAVSTFLAQLVPWWSLPYPMIWLIVTILGFAGLIAALAFAGPWRRHVLGPLTVVAAVTSVALLVDVLTGSHLQVNAVTGYEPVTGGRFYGFSNIAFAVYATGTILALAGVACALRERRRLAAAVCLAYGLFAIAADGWPGWGADFGGVPAFTLGFAVFALMLTGRRISPVRLALVAAAGGIMIAGIAVADWLRPAERRTHLGAFVQQVLDGEAVTVIGRKLGAMIGTLGNLPLTALSLAALAFLYLVLARPSRWGASALGRAYRRAPELRAGLFGALTCALVGFLMNDSGVAIPAMALTVAVPLTLAASVRALQLDTPTTAAPPSAPAEPTAPGPPAPR
jgi:hypothetical protein